MSLVALVQCGVCSYGGFLIEGDMELCLEGLGASGRGDIDRCLCLCIARCNDTHGVSGSVYWRISGQRPISPVLESTSLLFASLHYAYTLQSLSYRERVQCSNLENVCDRMAFEFIMYVFAVN